MLTPTATYLTAISTKFQMTYIGSFKTRQARYHKQMKQMRIFLDTETEHNKMIPK